MAQGQILGGIHGTVKDQQGSLLRGVVLTATSSDTSLPLSAITDDNGYYRFLNVPPGTYGLNAVLAGFAPFSRPNIVVRAGLNLSVDVALQIGGVAEGLTVNADTPMLESRDAVHGINVDGQTLRSVPLSERRNWYDALSLAPGVTTADAADGTPGFFVHGAGQESNVAQVDGADVGAANTGVVQYASFSPEMVEDIQIKTAALDAASPLGQGAIISVVTKSGTNEIRGAAALFYQHQKWNTSNVEGGTSRSLSQRTPDLALGGPVLRDRAWYFGAYRRTDAAIGISRTADQLELLRALVPSFEPYDNTNKSSLYFVKPTVNLGRHRLHASYQHNVNPSSSGTVQQALPQTFALGGDVSSVQLLSAFTARLTSDLNVSYNTIRRDGASIALPEPAMTIYQSARASGSIVSGIGSLISAGSPRSVVTTQPFNKLSVAGNVAYQVSRGLGAHDVRVGFYIQRLKVRQLNNYVNGGFAQEDLVLLNANDPSLGAIPFHRIVYDSTSFVVVNRRTSDVALYIQDSWRPFQRLTITPGVRVDVIRTHDRIFNVRSQASTDVGPRLGVNYLLTGDGRTSLRVSIGRIHESPATTAGGVGSAAPGRTDSYDRNLDGLFETSLATPRVTAVTANRILDQSKHQPYVDEFNLEVQRQLPRRIAASIGVTRRAYRHRGTMVEVNGLYEDSVFKGYRDVAANEIYQVTNNRWNWPIYTALEAAVTKSTSRARLIGSYTRQWRHLAGTWQPNDPAGFIQPNGFANDKGIGSPISSFSDANYASGYSDTLTAFYGNRQWQDHAGRIGLYYQFRGGFGLGGNYVYQSGVWSGPIFTHVAAPDPRFGAATVTLADGRQAQNPLSTLTRFAYDTRGDGQIATPSYHVLNLRFARVMDVAKATLEVAADIYNVTNNGADQTFNSGANYIDATTFGRSSARQPPRSVQLSVRLSIR